MQTQREPLWVMEKVHWFSGVSTRESYFHFFFFFHFFSIFPFSGCKTHWRSGSSREDTWKPEQQSVLGVHESSCGGLKKGQQSWFLLWNALSHGEYLVWVLIGYRRCKVCGAELGGEMQLRQHSEIHMFHNLAQRTREAWSQERCYQPVCERCCSKFSGWWPCFKRQDWQFYVLLESS